MSKDADGIAGDHEYKIMYTVFTVEPYKSSISVISVENIAT